MSTTSSDPSHDPTDEPWDRLCMPKSKYLELASKYKHQLSDLQIQLLWKAEEICESDDHSSFDSYTLACLWQAWVGIEIHRGQEALDWAVAFSKKEAKRIAAERALKMYRQLLKKNPPENFFEIEESVSEPTTSQLKEMSEDQQHLSVLKSMLQSEMGSVARIISTDLEMYELNNDVLLETGISHCLLGLSSKIHSLQSLHWIVEENMHLTNGTFVENNRDNFVFGTSEQVKMADTKPRFDILIQELVSGVQESYFVGHTIQSDIKWLQKLGIKLPDTFVLCDLGRAYRALTSPGVYTNIVGMDKLVKILGIDVPHMHNGGNDTRYNLDVLAKLLEIVSRNAAAQSSTENEQEIIG